MIRLISEVVLIDFMNLLNIGYVSAALLNARSRKKNDSSSQK